MKQIFNLRAIFFVFAVTLNGGLFNRNAAQKEYETIRAALEKIQPVIDFEQWRTLMRKVDAYAQKYGMPQDHVQWTTELELSTGTLFNKGSFSQKESVGLYQQIKSLTDAIAEREKNPRIFREKRYALELYKVLFEKLLNATPQKASKGSLEQEIRDFLKDGSFQRVASPIINKSDSWKALRKRFVLAAPLGFERYEKLLNDFEQSLLKYAGIYLGTKPRDRTDSDKQKAKDILRRLKANAELLRENGLEVPARKIYEPLVTGIERALDLQLKQEHR
jgi:hypothetical protein